MARKGWLEESDAALLGNMVGFRNILVHGYGDVDLSVVRDVLENRLDELLQFAAVVRARLPEPT